MGTLSAAELTLLRNKQNIIGTPVTWTKEQINTAFQIIEDELEDPGMLLRISTAIETAAPTIFTVQHKRRLYQLLAYLKARQGGIA